MRTFRFSLLAAIGLLLTMAGGAWGQTIFAQDVFTGTDGTALTAHTTTTTWTIAPGSLWATGAFTINSNAVNSNGNYSFYYASGTPSGADYTVQADLIYHTSVSGNLTGVMGHVSTSADTFYEGFYDQSAGVWKLQKGVAGTYAAIGTSTAQSLITGHTYTAQLVFVGNTQTLKVSDNGAAYVTVATASDTSVPAAGKAGIFAFVGSASTGWSIDNFSAFTPAVAGTSYTFVGPTSGSNGAASTVFTVTPNGTLSGADSVTLSDGGAGGTFSPASLSFSSSATAGLPFTYTPSSAGAKTITPTSATLGFAFSPAFIVYTASAASTSVPIGSTAVFYSPYNWFSSGTGNLTALGIRGPPTGGTASGYILTNMPGAYLKTNLVSTTSAGTFVVVLDTTPLSGLNVSACPTIAWSIDGQATQTQLLVLSASPVTVTLGSGLSAATHTITLWFRSVTLSSASAMGDRWNTPASCVKITGFSIDTASSLSAPTLRSKRAILFGDSITEGADAVGSANGPNDQDATQTYAQLLGAALDAEVGIVGNAYQGYQATGSGNFPVFASSWNYYYSGASRLFTSGGAAGGTLLTPTPDYLLDAQGTNDRAANQTTQQTLLQSQITAYRAAAGAACKILMLVPPGGYTRTAKSAANAAAGDALCYLLDAGSDFDMTMASGGRNTNDALHPTVRGHGEYESRLVKSGQAAGLFGAVTTTIIKRRVQ